MLQGMAPRNYEAVMEVREWGPPLRRARAVKALCGIAVGALATLAALTGWSQRRPPRPAPARESELVTEFKVNKFPEDCNMFMQWVGCQKKAWGCEENDGTLGWKCCCENDIWQAGAPPSRHLGSETILRLDKAADVCIGGPQPSLSGGFALAPCGKPNTRFQLPARGAGVIEMLSQPGKCLAVVEGDSKRVEAAACAPGGAQQMFQLTDGGMLQWSHSGDLCLDSEGGRTEVGSKVVLAKCAYWPPKPSQKFVPADAPALKEEKAAAQVAAGKPSLFCTSLMLPWSYEVGMLRSHLARGAVGIFGCDDWAVYSNESVRLKQGASSDSDVYCDVMKGTLEAKIGGAYHTALNTPVFRRFWLRVIEDPRAWKRDWVVKVDPDAVFFADRLKDLLRSKWQPSGNVGHAVWLNNCQLGLHGPIEVFNRPALGIYKSKVQECDAVAENHGQEDVYLGHCMSKLGVERVDAFNLLLESEWACNERPSSSDGRPPCFDRQVSFHPFKSVKSYFFCYDRAVKMSWGAPLAINSEPPSKQNHHHA